MKILIIYGTSEGQTRKIARFMEEVLQEQNHQVVIADTTEEPPTPEGYDFVFVGGSVHMFKYQSSVKEYIDKNHKLLVSINSAFFSISMAASAELESEKKELKDLTNKFLEGTSWIPSHIEYIAGALRFTKYDFFKKLVMKMIAGKKGETVDTSKDYEYTDWQKLEQQLFKIIK